jgi:hypothetical protein
MTTLAQPVMLLQPTALAQAHSQTQTTTAHAMKTTCAQVLNLALHATTTTHAR